MRIFSFALCSRVVDSRKLLAFEMRCYRRILKVCWKDKVSNKAILERVERHYSVVDLIKQRKQIISAHLPNEGSAIGENSDVGNGGR